MAGTDLDDRLDELYAADPADFVARRTELARELKRAGDKERAAAVAALRRPSRAAALVNRLARERRAELKAVLDAGCELAAAQEAALSGRGGADRGEALRGAARALHAAVTGLVGQVARDETAATAEKVRATLHAAAADEELRATVAAGRLEREAAPSGFGLGAVTEPPAAQPRPKGRARKATGDGDAAAARRQEREAAQRRKREEAQRRERLRRELREAKEAEAAAAAGLEAAQARLEEARVALRAAEASVREAQETLQDRRDRRARVEREQP
ncbi:MAG TPA: hypothetical protein VD931_16845 [Baekduia sp.]|nr:hypothetical protein [Baekduia sp.]